jgi:3-deoxy-D-manno-octulosonic-acid transferase
LKIKFFLARKLYSMLMRALLPFALLRLWWRGRAEPLYRLAWARRLGLFYGSDQAQQKTDLIWIHAVSLGETHAAAPLIDALRASKPEMRLLLTHGTATGWAAGHALLAPGDIQTWLPLDTPGGVRRFLRRFKPAVGVLMETEVWPNLVLCAHELGVPMVLANARLSQHSQRRGQKLAVLFGPVMASFAAVLAQTQADAQRLSTQGAVNVEVAGHLKFDVQVNQTLRNQGKTWGQQLAHPVVMFAASREGEEALLLDAWRGSAAQQQGTRLLIVPRHPQRFDEVAALIQARGWRFSRRSSWGGVAHSTPWPAELLAELQNADVYLGDTMGEMPLYYGMAQVALLGGSFAPFGGQNLIEAVAYNCPVIMGPHTYNFMQAAELAQAAGAAWRVADLPAAVDQLHAGMQSGAIKQAQLATQGFLEPHRGAAVQMAQVVLQVARFL